ncbi:MAG: hypothetical protein JNG88_03280 [Phycisphaerales bacterium]|nr:hypothetical protein [Phycisphaerales bacterium]
MRTYAAATGSLVILVIGTASAPALAQCDPAWMRGFDSPGIDGPNPRVNCVLPLHAPDGDRLIVGGYFSVAGGTRAQNIAAWDGRRWQGLGAGLNSTVSALCVTPGGNDLYVGGNFGTSGDYTQVLWYIARWDGSRWYPLGEGLAGDVRAIAYFEDASGPAIYAGGEFRETVDQIAVNGVAKWDGERWSALGEGLNMFFGGGAYALAVFDDGSGPALYVGGWFPGTRRGDVNCPNILKWTGSQWQPVGTGTSGPVNALTVADLGDGPALYAGGAFSRAGSQQATIARWDGATWSSVGERFSYGLVKGISSFEVDGQPHLFAVGRELRIEPDNSLSMFAHWDGHTWTSIGQTLLGGINEIRAVAVFEDGRGPALFLGGEMDFTATEGNENIARWTFQDGFSPATDGNGIGGYYAHSLEAIGSDLYVMGLYGRVGGGYANGIARFDGRRWHYFDTLPVTACAHVIQADFGFGPEVLFTGFFAYDQYDDSPIYSLVRQTQSGLELFGQTRLGEFRAASAAIVFDDGDGPALYVGGNFSALDGVQLNNVARWNGLRFQPVGPGFDLLADPTTFAIVEDFAIFDDGSGPALYAGGMFDASGTNALHAIAKWTGTEWVDVGGGLRLEESSWRLNAVVDDLDTFHDATGSWLVACGGFERAGNIAVRGLARWNGTEWLDIGDLAQNEDPEPWFIAVTVIEEGDRAGLYVGGQIPQLEGAAINHIARWDGVRWSSVGGGFDTTAYVLGLRSVDFGYGPEVWAVGSFLEAGGNVSARIARFGCVRDDIVGDLNCDQVINAFDIDAFVLALQDAARYAEAYPDCRIQNADTNADGAVNNFDIDPFVMLLAGD